MLFQRSWLTTSQNCAICYYDLSKREDSLLEGAVIDKEAVCVLGITIFSVCLSFPQWLLTSAAIANKEFSCGDVVTYKIDI